MTGTHDFGLTVLSVLIAMLASFTALDLAARVVQASGRWAAAAWLGTAAVTMGGGIWSMHFVAMLAFSMPGMEALYDPGLTVFSLLLAIGVTGLGFAVVAREGTGLVGLILSGLVMGLGIVGMHYTGMAAMRMPVTVNYDAFWVSVSVLVAIGASTASLRLAFQRPGSAAKIGAAIAMGLAISGMHFAGMQAASFHAHHTVDEALGRASIGQTNLALAVSATTFLILFLALIAAMFDRRFALLADKEAKALRRSEEQFRALYRNTPLPLHALNEAGELEEVSEAWLDLLGYERDEVIGRPLADFMTEESARRRAEVDWPLLMSEGGPIQREYKLLARDRSVLEVIATSKVERESNGRFVRVIGGLNDITARRRAEEALHQAQKMEAVGQLTGGIAHDFNNMLAGILGGLELLQKRLDTGRLDDTQRFIDAARTSAQRAAALTQRLLAFGRRQSLDVKAVEVEPLLRSLEDLLERTLGPDIRLSIIADDDLWPAKADPSQLESAVLNLAINARDAMPEGGELSIKVENATWGSP
ncbi:MAG TPA: MHYT domain-containing protein, partial [Pseudorhizobium sp.]|nr:MHYT domain-containing protein [Pseudorhizobium sp.]